MQPCTDEYSQWNLVLLLFCCTCSISTDRSYLSSDTAVRNGIHSKQSIVRVAYVEGWCLKQGTMSPFTIATVSFIDNELVAHHTRRTSSSCHSLTEPGQGCNTVLTSDTEGLDWASYGARHRRKVIPGGGCVAPPLDVVGHTKKMLYETETTRHVILQIPTQ